MADDDQDAALIFYWIAFNAAYVDSKSEAATMTERDSFGEYFGKILALDAGGTVRDAIRCRFSGPIRVLLGSRHVFQPFWNHLNGLPGYENLEERFEGNQRGARAALGRQDTTAVLDIVFDRLYVLRNQLIHGGATWKESVNRDTVRDGARIMEFLIPLFIELMMDSSDVPWGEAYYPFVES